MSSSPTSPTTPTPATVTTSAPTTRKRRNALLYGRSRAGKTALLGELAEHIFATTGLKTRVYTADLGGIDTIQPYVDVGIVEVVSLEQSDPWYWLSAAVRGKVRGPGGKWVVDAARNDQIGLWGFESLTSVADSMMKDLAHKSAAGISIGGGSNVSFKVSDAGDTLSIGGNNQAHYGIVQNRIIDEVTESQRLPGWVVWTASQAKDDDQNAAGKVVGPAIVGKAWTAEVVRLFRLTFRLDAVAGQMGGAERHILYFGNQIDAGSGGAAGLGNTRTPLDAKPLPATLEPASLVKAIEMIDACYAPSVQAIRARLGAKLK